MLFKRLLAGAALFGLAAAQVTSDCDPTKGDDCDPNPALGTDETWYFNSTPNGQLWETKVGPVYYDSENGAKFTVAKQGDSPTIRTKFYFFFGRCEFLLKAAPGKGIVSSMMLLSDDLDEIDWEFIGVKSAASTNYFGKGLEDFTKGEWYDMGDNTPHDDYHNYTIHWTEEKLEWWVDEKLVRTVTNGDGTETNGTDTYPQTPMRMSLGIWAGGDPRLPEGTREWAGGEVDFDEGPFDMYVKQARIEDFSSGKEFIWTDDTGSMKSIEVVEGNSTALDVINEKPKENKSIGEKFNELPQAAKVAVYAGGAAVAALILGALIFYCIRQRRRGATEARSALQRSEQERLELEQLQKKGIDADSFTEQATEYKPTEMKNVATSNAYNVPDSPEFNEKGFDQAGAFASAGALGGAAVMRNSTHSPANSYHDANTPGSPQSSGFGSPPPGFTPSQTPPIRPMSQISQMRSDSARYSRLGSPGPQSVYGANRMQTQSPGSSMSGGFNDNQGFGTGPGGYGFGGPTGYRGA
ncbi:hypothetical protein N3K66_002785 [Trichothecium roseum]|uniref:Uncharacterized protein n=1 Tax=Trichothecium roseum TaxID=47278 RepID=A0ACC0VBC5_9HYPO|nr:hypothetical protein N3K66_002785 [Trichothecium roseum]